MGNNKISVSLETIVQRNDSFLTADIGGELVMMSVEHNGYLGLNAMGAEIWGRTMRPIRVSALCNALQSDFTVNPETCKTEVLGFLNELLAHGLMQIADEAVA